MQLNPTAFNELLDNLGEPFEWRKSFSCACINPTSGAALHNCPVCDGKGRIWNPAVSVKAAIASSNTQLQWAKFGQWMQGDLVLSIPENSPLYDVAQFDRVVALTSTDEFSVPLVRGGQPERVHGKVVSLSRLFWLDGSTIVEGNLPTIQENGVPVWASGSEPPAGKTYSLTGIRYNEYYCFGQFSSDRMKHAGLRLPRKMVMRRFDLFGRNETA
jgi:hypothetical protein